MECVVALFVIIKINDMGKKIALIVIWALIGWMIYSSVVSCVAKKTPYRSQGPCGVNVRG
jgi:hypothetical protein